MNTKKTIRNILFTTIWIVLGGGILSLLVAAIGKKNKELCSDLTVTIKSKQDHLFIEETDVTKLLKAATNGSIKGQPMSAFNLHKLESLLEDNVWVKDAQLYFDNKAVLHVTVAEREPVARVFTTSSKSFYIDNDSKRLPLSDKISLRVPVFTDFPEKLNAAKEVALLNKIKSIASFIANDAFWSAQVAQINITNNQDFEMIPVVGNHVVELGNGEDIEKKFHRLFVFYKDVMSKTGFDRYANIDVQYDGQVVATKSKTLTKVDSVQLKRNVEKLLLQAQEMESDTTFTTNQTIEKPITEIDSSTAPKNNLSFHNSNNKSPDPVPLKSTLKKKTDEKPKKAKAVMPKRN